MKVDWRARFTLVAKVMHHQDMALKNDDHEWLYQGDIKNFITNRFGMGHELVKSPAKLKETLMKMLEVKLVKVGNGFPTPWALTEAGTMFAKDPTDEHPILMTNRSKLPRGWTGWPF